MTKGSRAIKPWAPVEVTPTPGNRGPGFLHDPVLVSVSDLQPEKTDMERHAPDPRGQALVEYMVKGAMEAYDKTVAYPPAIAAGYGRADRDRFEAALRERMAQVASTVIMGYTAIAENALTQVKIGFNPSPKQVIEAALGPVEP